MSRSYSKAERLLQLEQLLLAHPEGLRKAEIARRLAVHRSTAGRYVEEMSARLPIWEEDGRFGIERAHYLASVRLTIHESAALHLATRLMATRSDKHNPHASAALRKLGSALEGFAPFVARHLFASAEILDGGHLRKDEDYLDTLEGLTDAWSDGLPVSLDYRAGDGELRHFTFEPYFIEPYAVGRTTYTIGRVRERDDLRTLKLERVEALRPLKHESFEIPPDFEARALLRGAWGIWYEGEAEVVELLFAPAVAGRVRETQWHPTEHVEARDDGGLLWRAEVAEWREMLPWIRGWGADVEVLAPAALRAELAREAAEMAALYAEGTG